MAAITLLLLSLEYAVADLGFVVWGGARILRGRRQFNCSPN